MALGSSSARTEPSGIAAASAAEWKKLPERSRLLEPGYQHTFRPHARRLPHTSVGLTNSATLVKTKSKKKTHHGTGQRVGQDLRPLTAISTR